MIPLYISWIRVYIITIVYHDQLYYPPSKYHPLGQWISYYIFPVSLQERKFPQRYSGDYFRDTLPADLYELEQAVVDGDVFTVRKLLQAVTLSTKKGGKKYEEMGFDDLPDV